MTGARLVFRYAFFCILIAVVVAVTFFPSLLLSLTENDWITYHLLTRRYGPEFPLTNFPFQDLFTQYGTTWAFVSLINHLVGYNSLYHYVINLVLRIAASLAIFFLMAKVSKKTGVAAISAVVFGVSYAGSETTTWTTHYLTFLAIIILAIALYYWWKFQAEPSGKMMLISIFLSVFAIFTQPIRVFGLIPIILVGDMYYFLKGSKVKKSKSLIIFHLLLSSLFFGLIFWGTETLRVTSELSYKMIPASLLMKTVVTGSEPVVMSLMLFIGNVFISPEFFKLFSTIPFVGSGLLTLETAALTVTGISMVAVPFGMRKKLFKEVILLATIAIYPWLVFLSSNRLVNWDSDMVMSAQVGGAIFLASIVLVVNNWNKKREVSEIGLAGVSVIIFHLLVHWISSPLYGEGIETGFFLIGRYYTIPSVGAAIVWGFIALSVINWCSSLSVSDNLKIIIGYGLVFVLILPVVFGNILSVRNLLHAESVYLDRISQDRLWNKLVKFVISNPQGQRVYYLHGDIGESEKYIAKTFPYKIQFEIDKNLEIPASKFVYSQEQARELVAKSDRINFSALKYSDGELIDTTSEFILTNSKK